LQQSKWVEAQAAAAAAAEGRRRSRGHHVILR